MPWDLIDKNRDEDATERRRRTRRRGPKRGTGRRVTDILKLAWDISPGAIIARRMNHE